MEESLRSACLEIIELAIKINDEMKPISKKDYQKRIKRDAKLSKDNPDFEFYK